MIEQLASIPLGYYDWPDFNTHKKIITDICFQNEKPGVVESNINLHGKNYLWESKFDFLDSHQALADLKVWIILTAQEFVSQLNQKEYLFAITESWAHVTRRHGYHAPHAHGESTWSGIFYVEGNPTTGRNNFYWPWRSGQRRVGLDFIEDQYIIDFVPGRLILFPGIVLHDAAPYDSDDPRIVIAFNGMCI
jgi:uncharacterized protein (TIGR02466 family)